MKATRLILIGGFLGAGKTTLLGESARRLTERGLRVGLITNDQAPDLVDTHLLSMQGFDVAEVAGSCFCCNFQGLLNAAGSLASRRPADVLIGEPVGSCTDLSATILQPIKQMHRQQLELAPLSVLADPHRLRDVLTGTTGGLHPSAAYIVYKQLEEADWLVVNKVDLISPPQRTELADLVAARLPARRVFWISAQSGEGVSEWLDAALRESGAGERIAEVDYDTYAEGEAVLGWLNAAASLAATTEIPDWRYLLTSLMEALKAECARRSARVGHIKLLMADDVGHLVANLVRGDGPITVRGHMDAGARRVRLTINARVEISPAELERIVRDVLVGVNGSAAESRIDELRCLSPGRPQPTFRLRQVVALA